MLEYPDRGFLKYFLFDVKMDFSQLPEDVYYHIGLNLSYEELLKHCTISQKFASLCHNPLFWKLKTMHDFNISAEEFDQINWETQGGEKETYIKVAGEQGIPYPGSEKYGKLSVLLETAANTLNVKMMDKLFPLVLDYEIFRIIGRKNRIDIIKKFIAQYPHLKTEILDSSLLGAAEEGLTNLVTQLIKLGAHNFAGALNFAAESGHLRLIKLLIDKPGVDVDSAMALSARFGHLNVVYYMLAYGATDYDWTLANAAYGGNYDIINLMIYLGADDYDAALCNAAEAGRLDVVKDMINRGATDVDAAMLCGVESGKISVLQELVNHGATNFTRALEATVEFEIPQLSIIKFLLDKGAKVSPHTLLAAASNANVEIFTELFKRAPENPNMYAREAADSGNLPIVKFLLQNGADNIEEILTTGAHHPHILNYIQTNYQ